MADKSDEGILHRLELRRTDLACPFRAQLLHDRLSLHEQILPTLGDRERPAAAVGRVAAPFDVATLLEKRGGLGSCLAADVQGFPEIAHGVRPGGDRAERKVVNRAVIGVTAPVKFLPRLVNQDLESGQKQAG